MACFSVWYIVGGKKAHSGVEVHAVGEVFVFVIVLSECSGGVGVLSRSAKEDVIK